MYDRNGRLTSSGLPDLAVAKAILAKKQKNPFLTILTILFAAWGGGLIKITYVYIYNCLYR